MGDTTSSIEVGRRVPLLDETIGANLIRTVERVPDTEGVVSRHQGVRFTYRELWDEVERVARGLLALGIEKGDRVGIWSPNCAEWTLLQYATGRTGAILVNINPAYRPNELAYALGHSGVRLLGTPEAFKTSHYLEMLAGVREQLPRLERVVTLGTTRAGGPDDLLWDELLAASADVDI